MALEETHKLDILGRLELIERKFLSLTPFKSSLSSSTTEDVGKNHKKKPEGQTSSNQFVVKFPLVQQHQLDDEKDDDEIIQDLLKISSRKPANSCQKPSATTKIKLPPLLNPKPTINFKSKFNNWKTLSSERKALISNRRVIIKSEIDKHSNARLNDQTKSNSRRRKSSNWQHKVGEQVCQETDKNSLKSQDETKENDDSEDENDDNQDEDQDEFVYYDTGNIWDYLGEFDVETDEFDASRCELQEVKISMAHAIERKSRLVDHNDDEEDKPKSTSHNIPYKSTQIVGFVLFFFLAFFRFCDQKIKISHIFTCFRSKIVHFVSFVSIAS